MEWHWNSQQRDWACAAADQFLTRSALNAVALTRGSTASDDDVHSLKKNRPCHRPCGYFPNRLESTFPVNAPDPLRVAHVTTNLRNQTQT